MGHERALGYAKLVIESPKTILCGSQRAYQSLFNIHSADFQALSGECDISTDHQRGFS
jgi:hypothetical protein